MAAGLAGQGRDVKQRILDDFKGLPIPDQLTIIESVLRRLREEFQRDQEASRAEQRRRLVMAAETLLPDYLGDAELTVFTALDGEDFYAEG